MIDWVRFQSIMLQRGFDDPIIVADLYSLARIVIFRHFNYINNEVKQDLIAEGVLKALKMIKANYFDPTKSQTGVKNFLYTGMRNEMTNYLYRTRREILVDDFTTIKSDKLVCHVFVRCTIDYNKLKEYFQEYCNRFVNCTYEVAITLKQKGFEVINLDESDSPIFTGKRVKASMVNKLVCLMIWRIQDFCIE